MAEEQQDVYISGIAGSIDTWSKEVTQKSIETSLKQLNADSNSILRLLKATANGVDLSADQMKRVGDSLKNQATKVEENGDDANRNHQQEVRHNKGTFKALFDLHRGGNKKAAQFAADQATRDKNAAALHKLGYSKATSQRAANVVRHAKTIERLGKKLVAAGALVGAMMAKEQSAQEQGWMDRFNMARDMRQMGLFAGQELANKGMLEIAKTISETNFTFGEATEMSKRFSKAIGIHGVKATLDFANTMSGADDIGDAEGLMRKYALQFGDVANMSGLYMESLRRAGQLEGRSNEQLKKGMLEFMTGVEATSNVLKISMEEAAQLMSTAISPDQTGLLSLLDKSQQDNVKGVLDQFQAMGVNLDNSKLMTTLTGMLTAGSRDEFMLTEQGQGMLGNAFDLATLDFVSSLLPTFQTGTKEESNALFQESLKPFVDSQIAMGKDLKTIVLGDTNIQSDIGNLIQIQPLIDKMNESIRSTGGGEQVSVLSEYTQYTGMQRFEEAFNYKLPSYMQNLLETTEAISAKQLSDMDKTIASADNWAAAASNVASFWQQSLLKIGSWINTRTSEVLNFQDNTFKLLSGNWDNINWSQDDENKKLLEQFANFGDLKEYTSAVTSANSTYWNDTDPKDRLAKDLAGFQKIQTELLEAFRDVPKNFRESKEETAKYEELINQQILVNQAITEINAVLKSLNN